LVLLPWISFHKTPSLSPVTYSEPPLSGFHRVLRPPPFPFFFPPFLLALLGSRFVSMSPPGNVRPEHLPLFFCFRSFSLSYSATAFFHSVRLSVSITRFSPPNVSPFCELPADTFANVFGPWSPRSARPLGLPNHAPSWPRRGPPRLTFMSPASLHHDVCFWWVSPLLFSSVHFVLIVSCTRHLVLWFFCSHPVCFLRDFFFSAYPESFYVFSPLRNPEPGMPRACVCGRGPYCGFLPF